MRAHKASLRESWYLTLTLTQDPEECPGTADRRDDRRQSPAVPYLHDRKIPVCSDVFSTRWKWRPISLSRQYLIPKDRYICVYTDVIVPSDDAESLQGDRDYLVTVESGGRKTTYDGELFDSVLCNYGRFANDLGLQQTIDYAVQQAGLATYSYFAKRDVEMRSKNTANCVFRVERTGTGGKRRLILAAAKEIPPGGVLELSASYGFFTYWTVAVARTPNRLPSAISDPVLWLLLSSYSALNDDERRQFTNDLWDPQHGLQTLPERVKQLDLYWTRDELDDFTNALRLLSKYYSYYSTALVTVTIQARFLHMDTWQRAITEWRNVARYSSCMWTLNQSCYYTLRLVVCLVPLMLTWWTL